MVMILFFLKFICTGNYLLLTGHRICHYLMERIMALQQMIDEKNTFSFVQLILSRFYPGQTNFVHSTFEDYPISYKICKIATN